MAGAAGPEVRWRRADDVLVRRTSRSVVVLPSEATEPVLLSGAAVAVWDALAAPADTPTLVASVTARFSGPAADRDGEIVATCEALQRCGAVVRTP